MPGEEIDRANPQPLKSYIPDEVLQLSVKLEKLTINDDDLKALGEFRRASDYIAAGKSILQLSYFALYIPILVPLYGHFGYSNIAF